MECKICGNGNLSLITQTLRGGTEGRVYYCPNCDLGVLEPRDLNVKEYYDSEYRKKFTDHLKKPESDPEDIFNSRKNYQDDRIDIVKKYFDKNKSFLEIGCSAGQFLRHIKDSFEKCEGVELDSKCADFVENKFNIKVCKNELSQCGFEKESFDFIAAFQVLEHTLNPAEFLFDVKKHLKDGGKIFIEVPNLYDALLKVWQIPAYQRFYYHEAHTHYFSKKSLEKLFEKTGYKIDEIHFIQDYNLLNHFYWYFMNGPQEDCRFGLDKPNIEFSKEHSEIGDKLNALFKDFDAEYRKILSDNEITSNIFVVASKKL
ncbi:MAG: class I SAM-dependent methyltransferase [Candidatus Wolfebacteria bacterium]|nr:class I SAM-dependent methyltransferase [Candidatus Wolfebacteria bacterium]